MTVAQQASAVQTVRSILSGQSVKPSRKEIDYLCEKLDAAAITLRWLERNEAAIKKKVGA